MTETQFSFRPFNCELNYLSAPDGSTMFMQGDTSVLAGIYGPVEAKVQKSFYNKASIETNFGQVKGPTSINDRLLELYIRDICEGAILTALHPASTISINIQELQDSGGLLACAINAACLALINSSVPMKYTFAAVCCMIDKDSENVVIDPNATQIQNSKALFTFAFDSLNKELICCQSCGQFTEKDLLEAVNSCKEASQYVFDFYRDIVKKSATLL